MFIGNVDFSGIKAVIWDFDGVFYSYDCLPNKGFIDLCVRANVKAVQELIPDLSADKASLLALESYAKFHDCVSAFLPEALNRGLDSDEFKVALYERYHEKKFELVSTEQPRIIAPNHELISLFYNVQDKGIKQGLLTHSCPVRWAKRALERMELLSFFDEDHILGLSDFDFRNKGVSAYALALMMERLDVSPRQVLFVEDSLSNLQVAKSSYPDITTALISKPAQSILPDVDFSASIPAGVIKQLSGNTAPRNVLQVEP
jgi:phosphoglycolate phosphatase-like HAD superfamily hydrolase